MASAFPGQISAVDIGIHFIKQYYPILQREPSLVFHFYTDDSTMMRIYGSTTETATAIREINSLLMSLNFTRIEIKKAHSLDSWNGGVLVTVSGYVQIKEFSGRRQFVQTFSLAPMEKGYFILNDIFHLLNEEQMHQHSAALLSHNNFETKHAPIPNPIPETVSGYMLGGEIQARDFVSPRYAEENDSFDMYSISELLQQASECDERVEESPADEPVPSFPSAMYTVQDPPPAPAEEPVREPPRQTYASVLLRPAKGQSGHTVSHPAFLKKSTLVPSECHHAPHPTPQHSYPTLAMGPEKPIFEAVEEVATLDDEGEGGSVYIRNLPSSVSASDIRQEFKNFGRVKPNGVAVRTHKESGTYYALVEFVDAIGVLNALQASPIQFNGRKIYVEERMSNNSNIARRNDQHALRYDAILESHFYVDLIRGIFRKSCYLPENKWSEGWRLDTGYTCLLRKNTVRAVDSRCGGSLRHSDDQVSEFESGREGIEEGVSTSQKPQEGVFGVRLPGGVTKYNSRPRGNGFYQ